MIPAVAPVSSTAATAWGDSSARAIPFRASRVLPAEPDQRTMMRTARFAPLFLLCAVLVACAPGPERPAVSPAAAAASPLLAHCPAGSPERMLCLEEALLDTLRHAGIASAMETLERIGAVDEQIRRDGHVYAHVIGLAAYTTPDQVGRAFAECTPAFQSGCYHGVIQSYFVDLAQGGAVEVDAEQVNALCADYRGDEDSLWLLFQCAHGMGHGLTMVEQYHLPGALAACDRLASPWERDVCHGGVFMESIINETNPHHTTGRPQQGEEEHGHQHGAHAPTAAEEHAAHASADQHAHHGHGQPDRASRTPFPALDPADHHYPCSALDERYAGACYLMQTSVVLHFTEGDFAAAARMCDGAPAEHRQTCYQSLGRDASSYAVQVHREGLRLCSVGDPQLRSWCHVGYVKNVIDVTADAEDGMSYCRLLPAGETKEHCYRAVGHQVFMLTGEPARREAMCATAEPGYAAQCRLGANLPEESAAAR